MKPNNKIIALSVSLFLIVLGIILESTGFMRTYKPLKGAENEEPVLGYSDGVFRSEYYTIAADESKWEYSEEDSADCTFSYKVNTDDVKYSTAKLNVVSMSGAEYESLSPQDYAQALEKTYEGAGHKIQFSGESKLGDNDSYELVVSIESGDESYTVRQILISDNGTLTAISYNVNESVSEELEPEFEKILKSFKFTESE